MQDYVPLDEMPSPLQVNSGDIKRCVLLLAPASAGGGSGLRPSHLKEMVNVPSPAKTEGFADALTRRVNILSAGKAPQQISLGICGAP